MAQTASFREAGSVALDSLRSSKLRSFLTLLGIILATTTLIAVMSIINGMNAYVAENISDMGADGFIVLRMAFLGDFDPKKYLELQKKNPRLNTEEFAFLKQRVTLCRELGLTAERGGKVSYPGGGNLEDVGIRGGGSDFAALSNYQVVAGRFMSVGAE